MNKKKGLTHRKDATGLPLEANNGVLSPTSVAVKALVKREAEVIVDEQAVLNREEQADLREDVANLREDVVDMREEAADKREKVMRDHEKRIRTKVVHSVHKEVIDDMSSRPLNEEESVFTILTPREREVLKLISQGRSTAQIAISMNISIKTVDTHRQHIMDKLNIRGIADLTRYAIREGIADL